MIKENKLFLLLKLGKAFEPFYRLNYASSAASSGFLEVFSNGSVTFDEIQSSFANNKKSQDMLMAWLQLGIKLKELKKNGNKYELSGFSEKLSLPEYDAYNATVQEVVAIHHKLISKTPEIIQTSEKWNFEDHDGSLVARSSRTLEPFVFETIESYYPTSGKVDLLEIGCGAAVYLKHAALLNNDLNAVGLELQKSVFQMAVENINQWGLNNRISIKCEDIRSFEERKDFDVASLYNNIYYFDIQERIKLFNKIKTLLKPGGIIVITSGCQGGSPIIEMLNLWCVTTKGHDRLPSEKELLNQLVESGFKSVKSKQLIPGDQFFSFVGIK